MVPAHQSRGRPFNNKIQVGIQSYAVVLVRKKMAVPASNVPRELAT